MKKITKILCNNKTAIDVTHKVITKSDVIKDFIENLQIESKGFTYIVMKYNQDCS